MEFLKGYDCVGCNGNIFPNPKDILFKLRILVDVFWRSCDIFCKSLNPSCVKRPNMQLLLRHKCAYFNMKLSTGSHIQIRQTDLFKHDGRCISYSTISIASWYVKNFQAIHCLFNVWKHISGHSIPSLSIRRWRKWAKPSQEILWTWNQTLWLS